MFDTDEAGMKASVECANILPVKKCYIAKVQGKDANELLQQGKAQKIIDIIRGNFDLSPFGIKSFLQLDRPIYAETASYGHFGRRYDESKGTFTWESLSSSDLFKNNF